MSILADEITVTPALLEKYEAVIGIECHVELKTVSKMFCGCPNAFGGEPNTNVCPVCLAFPGALPVPNATAIEHMFRAGLAFGATIPPHSKFDRKNYFYPDMPKNYQISQYDMPLTLGGVVRYWLEDGTRRECRLTRIHLEEDTGKSTHVGSADGRLAASTGSLIDFNRAGVPLMECVSEPDIRSAGEAVAYLETLARTFRELGVSDVKMEEGSLRCDANVSIRKRGETALGTKAEIKNMNSFRSVRRAIESEIARQIAVVEGGGRVIQETRGWDEAAGVTHSQRSKEQAHDYRYFPDPDLVPVDVAEEAIARVRAALPEIPYERYVRYVDKYGLDTKRATQLVEDHALAAWFDRAVVAANGDAKAVVAFVLRDLSRLANETGTHIAAGKVTPEALAEVVALTQSNAINSKAAKQVLEALWSEGGSAKAIVEREGLAQITDTATLGKIIDDVLQAHQSVAAQYQAGKTNVLGALTGHVLRATRAKADPALVQALLKDKLALSFDKLLSALPEVHTSLPDDSDLHVAKSPPVFVAPTFAPTPPSAYPVRADIVFIRASAAVGKSTICNAISAAKFIPILDLSTVPVGAAALKGLLLSIAGTHAIDQFNGGELPLIVDALDEGRLLSGVPGLEKFLEQTARLAAADSTSHDKPKLIFVGRPDAVELAAMALEFAAPSLRISLLDVRLFDLDGAMGLIRAYGDANPRKTPEWTDNPKPVNIAILAYFDAIANALGLKPGELWNSDEGRAFAGYAPVLRAVGELIAENTDFQAVAHELSASGGREAWGVIERVLEWMLNREQAKLRSALIAQAMNISDEAYDAIFDCDEQLAFLYQAVGGQPLEGSGRVTGLSSNVRALYLKMVEQLLPDHPFLRHGASDKAAFGNNVLAAYVTVRAMKREFYGGKVNETLLESLTQSPFLWRSFESNVEEGLLLNGQQLGYLLGSYWNDPVYDASARSLAKVVVNSVAGGAARVSVPYSKTKRTEFEIVPPVMFVGKIRDAEVSVRDVIVLKGYAAASGSPVFATFGDVSVAAQSLIVDTHEFVCEGRIWLEANDFRGERPISLDLEDAIYGWGGALPLEYPWSKHSSIIRPAGEVDNLYVMAETIARKSMRTPIYVNDDYSLPGDSKAIAWARRLGPAFKDFLRALVQEGFAKRERVDSSGDAKIRIVFAFAWDELLSALKRDRADPKFEMLAEQLRGAVHIQ